MSPSYLSEWVPVVPLSLSQPFCTAMFLQQHRMDELCRFVTTDWHTSYNSPIARQKKRVVAVVCKIICIEWMSKTQQMEGHTEHVFRAFLSMKATLASGTPPMAWPDETQTPLHLLSCVVVSLAADPLSPKELLGWVCCLAFPCNLLPLICGPLPVVHLPIVNTFNSGQGSAWEPWWVCSCTAPYTSNRDALSVLNTFC